MSMLTIEQIDQKIRTAQENYDQASDEYGRNVAAQIRDEYRKYRAEVLARLAKLNHR